MILVIYVKKTDYNAKIDIEDITTFDSNKVSSSIFKANLKGKTFATNKSLDNVEQQAIKNKEKIEKITKV